jgi:hydroxyacylglutathione hydrolase
MAACHYHKRMKIHTLVVGPIQTNCYIVEDGSSHEAAVIDPGGEAKKIIGFIREHELKVTAIIITHGHFDHVGANQKLKDETGAPILVHPADDFFLPLSDSPLADRHLQDGDSIAAGSIPFRVIHTPGHTPGGICLYSEKEKILFSGDTLFGGTYGRTDLPYSSQENMLRSLERLYSLPPETAVYPGHGRPTTIKVEKELFPYD